MKQDKRTYGRTNTRKERAHAADRRTSSKHIRSSECYYNTAMVLRKVFWHYANTKAPFLFLRRLTASHTHTENCNPPQTKKKKNQAPSQNLCCILCWWWWCVLCESFIAVCFFSAYCLDWVFRRMRGSRAAAAAACDALRLCCVAVRDAACENINHSKFESRRTRFARLYVAYASTYIYTNVILVCVYSIFAQTTNVYRNHKDVCAHIENIYIL